MQRLFFGSFKEPRRACIAADGCEIIQRAFIAASAPACPWLCSKADTDLGDYCTDGDLQTNEIVSGEAPLVQAWLLRVRAWLQHRPTAPVPGFDFSWSLLFPVLGVSPSRIAPTPLLG